jgi:ribonuclease Z
LATLHLLGTGAALAAAERTTTMVAFESESVVAVDCGGDLVQRMLVAGIDLGRLELLILTHEHADHVSGFPLFMEKIWLAQRRRPIPVRGPAPALDQARRIFEAFDTSGWKGLPEIEWGEVPLEEGSEVWSSDRWRITASPGQHSVPVIGIRVAERGGGVVTYSSDTERADAIVRLARESDILVHEATGDFSGHISARGAAEVAREAGVGRLVLVHIPPRFTDEDLAAASEVFDATEVGSDGGRYTF